MMKVTRKILFWPWCLLLAYSFNPVVYANFSDRFDIEKNAEGKIVTVKAKHFIKQVGIGPFISILIQALSQLPSPGKNKSALTQEQVNLYQENVASFINALKKDVSNHQGQANKQLGQSLSVDNSPYPVQITHLGSSLDYFAKHLSDVALWQQASTQVTSDPELRELMEKKFPKIAYDLRPEVLAKPQDPTHFFRQYVVNQVLDQVFNLIIRKLPSIPYLGVVRTVLQDLRGAFDDQRTYQQNILLAYLTERTPEENGLTALEVNTILSSIYASKLGAQAAIQLQKLQANWPTYGAGMQQGVYLSTARQIQNGKFAGLYEEKSQIINFAFGDIYATNPSSKVSSHRYYNFVNKSHIFSQQPSLAWDEAHPQKVKQFRLFLKLAEMGLDALPIPGLIKNAANTFAQSCYQEQRLTEGALVGHLEMKGQMNSAAILKDQSLHPYFY